MQFRFRSLFALLLTGFLWLTSSLFSPSAYALTQVRLFDLSYHPCSADLAQGAVTSQGVAAASCYIVTGKAENKSGKPVINADIFGRIYDANHDNVMENRNRIGSIDEIPPGISDFEFRISVPANQPTPLELEQFKAAGFTGTVRR